MLPKKEENPYAAIHATLRVAFAAATAFAFCLAARGAPSDLVARGAYLARITGCVGCHSPRTRSADVVENRLLSGGDHPIAAAGNLGRFYPPNITPDKKTGLGDWQLADIVKAVKTGATPDGRVLSTAMPWRTQYDQLSDPDAMAIAAYLKSLPPIRNSVPPPLVGAQPGR
jgi:mono/diheme cytochrome c family protein